LSFEFWVLSWIAEFAGIVPLSTIFMLTQYRKPVYLSIVSTDLPVWSDVQAIATIYQRDRERFHLLLTEPKVAGREAGSEQPDYLQSMLPTPRLLWLDLSPYRITMTMQGDGKLSYRHHWERGVYGISRYWLQNQHDGQGNALQLRNFTRRLNLDGHPLPELLQLEYELWADQIQLGCYVLNLEIMGNG
jgi:hypothetical protein